jgi:hypothetical protein
MTFSSNAKISHLMRAAGERDGERSRDRPGTGGAAPGGRMWLLRPEEQAFTAMLDGWAAQQLALRAIAAHAKALPWSWTAQLADE